MDSDFIKISPIDNVAVALRDIKAGEEVRVKGEGELSLTAADNIPFGHKIALRDIEEGENIVKYGYPIGHALCGIKKGSFIHVQNLKTNLSGEISYEYKRNIPTVNVLCAEGRTFMGYKRSDGRAGTRNEVFIIPTVGCVNNTAKILEEEAQKLFAGRCDGVHAFTHNMGCSQLGDDQDRTQQILAGIINNPNAGAVLVLSLGCENNNLGVFKPYLGKIDEKRVKFLVAQEVEDEIAEGLKLLDELTEYASSFKREELPLSFLTIGFKCGGSDAFSGITANPLCGRICDSVTKAGGSTILTEVPEMFGAETILMNRAQDGQVFGQVVSLINNFKAYYKRYGQTIYENPSPGNKAGGISSLEEKSLGCIQKGGNAVVTGVLSYGEQIVKNGLNLLAGPGNDQVSCTNLTASGANLILFTTGRGNPFGSPVPTVKLSTNTKLFEKKNSWIDFNAGTLIDGESFENAEKRLLEFIIDTASGKKTKNEINGYRDISIFRDGVIL